MATQGSERQSNNKDEVVDRRDSKASMQSKQSLRST